MISYTSLCLKWPHLSWLSFWTEQNLVSDGDDKIMELSGDALPKPSPTVNVQTYTARWSSVASSLDVT